MNTGPTRTPESVISAEFSSHGLQVIDVGCGEGALSRFFIAEGARTVVGVECGTEMLRMARAGSMPAGLSFEEGVGQDLPLDDASCDLVVFSNSLHHVPAAFQGQALAEAHRVLVPNGRLLVLEPIARGPYQHVVAPVHDESEIRAHAQAELAAAQRAGLFRSERSFEFTKRASFSSFESFRDRMLRIDPSREAVIAQQGERWRHSFESLGEGGDEGWSFSNPVQFDLLRRAPRDTSGCP